MFCRNPAPRKSLGPLALRMASALINITKWHRNAYYRTTCAF